jgi:hypothetical protein
MNIARRLLKPPVNWFMSRYHDGRRRRLMARHAAAITEELHLGRLTAQLAGLRIAVVKQEVLPLLYCCPPGSSPFELLRSSMKHPGPLALATLLAADFYIVKLEESPECMIWRQKITYCGKPATLFSHVITEPFRQGERGHDRPQGTFALRCDDIDWARYDIVISIDIAVPIRIVASHPNILWCYCISEPCMPAYWQSLTTSLAGYDIFLNQRFGLRRWWQRQGEINWPFNLLYCGCFDDILGPAPPAERSLSIFIEAQGFAGLSEASLRQLERLGETRTTRPRTLDIVQDLRRSKYFLQLDGRRRLWGNAMIEAVAAGCLALGRFGWHKNRALFTEASHVRNLEAAVALIAGLERDPQAYAAERSLQRRLLDYYCLEKPLLDLQAAYDAKRGRPKASGAGPCSGWLVG